MNTLDQLEQDQRSPEDRARGVVHAACLNPDEQRALVRGIAKAISDAETRGLLNRRALMVTVE